MKQTLGNRILHHRKRLGLTQEQLAEQMGVTAQAVSKWENDLSCPDIAALPRLAAIFGITTDTLLGSVPEPPVAAPPAADDSEPEAEGHDLHISRGGWEFKWDSGRRSILSMALLVLAVGGQLLAARLLNREIGFWSIAWTSAFLVFGFTGLLHRFSFWLLGATLTGAYFILDNWQVLPFTLGGELIFPLILLLFGLSLLLDAFKRPKKAKYSFTHKDSGHKPQTGSDGKKTSEYSVDNGFLSYSGSFGDHRQNAELPLLTGGDISTSFGDFTLDLSGVEAVSNPCVLDVNSSFGDTRILVPRKFTVKVSSNTSFADVAFSGHPDPESQGIITLNANANFGDILICYI